jgi:hypothetical protein
MKSLYFNVQYAITKVCFILYAIRLRNAGFFGYSAAVVLVAIERAPGVESKLTISGNPTAIFFEQFQTLSTREGWVQKDAFRGLILGFFKIDGPEG